MNQTKNEVPKLIRDFLKEINADVYAFEFEAPGCGWTVISETIVGEDKYWNDVEFVYQHDESGRFFRFNGTSLPYGIDSYGDLMESDQEPKFVEVFPVEVRVVQYLSKQEKESQA